MISFFYGEKTLFLGDEFHPHIQRTGANQDRNAARATATAPFPFFDDFSKGSVLDTNLWIANPESDEQLPTISVARSRNAPTKGVLTFDGATHKKRKHSNLLETDIQDVLVSQSFDLSAFLPADDIYLSFFYQRGGWGDAPELTDNLKVYFDTTGNDDYIEVWSADGDGAAESRFTLAMIPLTEGAFFHPDFKFKFESYGSLNGELDVWNVDYVYFAVNRGPEDTVFVDTSPTKISAGPLGEYTAIPRNHYQTGGFVGAPEAEVSNLQDISAGTPVTFVLSDPVGGNALTGSLSQTVSSGLINPYSSNMVSAAPYADQAAAMNQYGTLRVFSETSLPGDQRPENDTLFRDFRVDTILAFDDGQPDAGYGLTTARSFCMQFRIPEPDTISAVWIAFAPSLHYHPVINQSTCLDNATFKLSLWDTLVPDSFRTQQGTGMVVRYDSADNYFQRFTFINPQVVDTVFYLGIRQNTDKPLGVGFDKQGPSGRLFFEDGNAAFTQSSLSGSVMIRPEFANIPDGSVHTPNEQVREALASKLYPNPWRSGELWLEFETSDVREGEWRLVDLQGRVAAQGALQRGERRTDLALPAVLGAGMYLLQAEGRKMNGEHFGLRKRLLIQN